MRGKGTLRSRKGRARLGRVCTTITGKTPAEVATKAALAFRLGTDIVEFRVDHVEDHSASLAKVIETYSERAVVTVRTKAEGGRYRGSEEQRLAVISELARLQPLYIDVELSTAKANLDWFATLPRTIKKIVSWHDFTGTPSLLVLGRARVEAAKLGDVAKVVTMSRGERDNLRVLKLYGQDPRKLVAFCMGDLGTVTRIESLRLGSPVVYAALPGDPAAPGQLSVSTLAGMKVMWESR